MSPQFFYECAILAALFFGITLGVVIPVLGLGLKYGFRVGLIVGLVGCPPITLLSAVLSAYILASAGEELLGTVVGVPIGLFLGCLLGAAFFTFLFGVAGLWVDILVRQLRSRKAGEEKGTS
jgi:hypothetical protein